MADDSGTTKAGTNVDYADGKVEVNGVQLAYAKVGSGKHALILIPGALGAGVKDFALQLKTLDRERFTIVTFDPRGYGKSIPPERDFPVDFFHRDADDAAGLMEKLGFSRYSVLGWSDGGNIACLLAARHSEQVEKLIEWGAGAYVTTQELEEFGKMSNVSKTWADWHAGYVKIFKEREGDIFVKELDEIKAPTLIIHGKKDTTCPFFHAEYIHKKIKNSVTEFWEDAGHSVHKSHTEKFNALVERFLLE